MPNIYLTPHLERLAREYAMREHRSLSGLVQVALQEWIHHHAERPRTLVDTPVEYVTHTGDTNPRVIMDTSGRYEIQSDPDAGGET